MLCKCGHQRYFLQNYVENIILFFADMTDSVEEAYVKEHIVASGFDNTTVGYGHLNAYGHELLAQCIYDAIGEEEQR